MTDGSVDRRRFLGILGLGAGALAPAGPPDRSEMSLCAYTQAGRAGFGALELSLARTRDGVWFGLHDATLDRTSGVTGKTAKKLTWAKVQRYRILGSTAADDPTQPDRPYLRWEELIAAPRT